jgi:hypothetical protein
VFVGAHHLARVFTVTLALPVIVRFLAPAKKTKLEQARSEQTRPEQAKRERAARSKDEELME